MDIGPHTFNYNYGKPDLRLPYRSNSDKPYSLPLAPKSVHVTSPYIIGALDIRWDAPTNYSENNCFNILGINIYKSYDTPEGPYELINQSPITTLSYRDETREIQVVDEDPMLGGRIIMGTNANKEWVVKTFNRPIIIPGSNGEHADHPKHVTVRIKRTSADDFVTVPAFKVVGNSGEIFLISSRIYDHSTNQLIDPLLPDPNRGGEIQVSYSYINNIIDKTIDRKIYYKVTTVGRKEDLGPTSETPLNEVEAVSAMDIEKLDFIWAEAIRRNKWILEQAGERVKLFIRRWSGERCSCWQDEYQQAKENCLACFGTGYLGGYVGPVNILIAPPEAEKTVDLLDIGMHLSYEFNTWTGPYPLLTDRDFLIRQNNMRFSIAHINPQGSRGAIYQQHFNIAPLDQKDIRYSVPVTGGIPGVPDSWNAFRVDSPTDASPAIPNKPEIPDQYERMGRTVTFENIMF